MKSILHSIFVIVAAASIAMAADKPNFSGIWKMNVAKSNFGANAPLTSYTRQVTHAEPSLTIEDDQKGGYVGAAHFIVKYTTDGKAVNYDLNGIDMNATATWEGDAIVTTSRDTAGFGLATKGKMTLSDGGKTLTLVFSAQTPQGALDVVFVFDKQ